MDDFQKILQDLARARAAKASITQADADAYVREESRGLYRSEQELIKAQAMRPGLGRGLSTAIASGATLGGIDEIADMVKPGSGATIRQNQRDFAQDHSALSMMGELAGGALPAAAAGLAGGSAMAAAPLRTMLGVDAVMGGAQGALTAEPGERTTGGILGGVLGAAGGLVAGKAPGVLQRMFSPRAQADARLRGAMVASGGGDALFAELARLEAAGRGDITRTMDLSPHLNEVADFAANNNPITRQNMRAPIFARRAGAAERLVDDVAQAQPGMGEAVLETRRAALEQQRRATYDPMYQTLRQDPTRITREQLGPLQEWFGQHKIADLLEQAQKELTVGETLQAPSVLLPSGIRLKGARVDAANATAQVRAAAGAAETAGRPADATTFGELFSLKKKLDDAVGVAFAKGSGDLGTRLRTVRDRLDETLGTLYAPYRGVQQGYRQAQLAEEALAEGAADWNRMLSPRRITEKTRRMSPAELEQYRYGSAHGLYTDLSNRSANRDAAGALMNASMGERRKLELIFGDQATFETFMERVRAESRMAEGVRPFGGSPTHFRDAAAGAEIEPVGAAIAVAQGGVPAGRAMLGGAYSRIAGRDATARAAGLLEQPLMATGRDAITPVIERVMNPARRRMLDRMGLGASALTSQMIARLLNTSPAR